MTLNELLKILDFHGIVHERITSISVKVFTASNRDDFDILEVIGQTAYLNGLQNFNIWDWLGY